MLHPRGGAYLREVLPTPLAGNMSLDAMPPFYISSSCSVAGWSPGSFSFCFHEEGNKRRCRALFASDERDRLVCYCGALGGSPAECASGGWAGGAYTIGRELLRNCVDEAALSTSAA